MVVGLCQITILIHGNRSLKGKRQIVRKLCDRIRNKFNISVAEVGDLDQHQSSRIGFAVVGNETGFVQSMLDNILEAIDQMQLAPLHERHTEILHYDDQFSQGEPLGDRKIDGWDFMDEWDDLK